MRPNPQDVDLVIYHEGCTDGFGAAWAAWKLLGDGAEYMAATFGDQVPNVAGRKVAILDFSYDRADLERMIEQSDALIVLDHHKSAEENLGDIEETVFDMNHSGAILSWKFFHPNENPPEFLLYIEDRDLWHHSLPNTKEVSAMMSLVSMTFESFDAMSNPPQFEELVNDGFTVLAHNESTMKKICRFAQKSMWKGHEIYVVNSPHLQSEIGNFLAEECDFAVVWYYDHQRREYKVSLRSAKDCDVSKIAQTFGGGGHQRAAGFVLGPNISPVQIFHGYERAHGEA